MFTEHERLIKLHTEAQQNTKKKKERNNKYEAISFHLAQKEIS